MDWVRLVLTGGWIPVEKRTQWLGAAGVAGAIIMSVLQWGAGTMDVMTLFHVLGDKWPLLMASFGLAFLGDKVDKTKVMAEQAAVQSLLAKNAIIADKK